MLKLLSKKYTRLNPELSDMKPRHYVEEIDPMEVNAGSQRRAKTRLEKPPEERPQSDM